MDGAASSRKITTRGSRHDHDGPGKGKQGINSNERGAEIDYREGARSQGIPTMAEGGRPPKIHSRDHALTPTRSQSFCRIDKSEWSTA